MVLWELFESGEFANLFFGIDQEQNICEVKAYVSLLMSSGLQQTLVQDMPTRQQES